jgi:hypothetical protein
VGQLRLLTAMDEALYEALKQQVSVGEFVLIESHGISQNEEKSLVQWPESQWWKVFKELVRVQAVSCRTACDNNSCGTRPPHCGEGKTIQTARMPIVQFGGDGSNLDARGRDDMLFCVFSHSSMAFGDAPFVALRRLPDRLPAELEYGGSLYNRVDWRRTLYLNIVMHSPYRLTVAMTRSASCPAIQSALCEDAAEAHSSHHIPTEAIKSSAYPCTSTAHVNQ